MAIKYHYHKNPSGNPKKGLHPRIVRSQKLTTLDMARRISDDSSFTAGDVTGLLTILKDILVEELMEGKHFEWENLGIFSLSLASAPAVEGKEMLPSRVYVKKINLRLDKKVKNRLKQAQFERLASPDSPSLPVLAPKERQDRILSYLQKHEFIETVKAMSVNGCSRATASRDLNKLKKEGLIRIVSGIHATLYTLTEKSAL